MGTVSVNRFKEEDFKCRCSAIGQIMTNSRSKSEPLSSTCLTYLRNWLYEYRYGIKSEIKSKYLEKGIVQEETAITLLTEVYGKFYIKNELSFVNAWLTGTPDIITSIIIDTKCSWNIDTFPRGKKLNKLYEYQMQGYMDLTGKEKACVAYCLVDTPEQLIEDELYRTAMKSGLIDLDSAPGLEDEIRSSLIFSDKIPAHERVIKYHVKRDDKVINAIHERVLECRAQLMEWQDELDSGKPTEYIEGLAA